jgi:hypothetical protein
VTASSKCHHPDLHFHLNHVCMADTNVHYLEVTAKCNVCDAPMLFRGCPLGLTPAHPTASLGGDEIRLPMIAEGEEPTGKHNRFRRLRSDSLPREEGIEQ